MDPKNYMGCRYCTYSCLPSNRRCDECRAVAEGQCGEYPKFVIHPAVADVLKDAKEEEKVLDKIVRMQDELSYYRSIERKVREVIPAECLVDSDGVVTDKEACDPLRSLNELRYCLGCPEEVEACLAPFVKYVGKGGGGYLGRDLHGHWGHGPCVSPQEAAACVIHAVIDWATTRPEERKPLPPDMTGEPDPRPAEFSASTHDGETHYYITDELLEAALDPWRVRMTRLLEALAYRGSHRSRHVVEEAAAILRELRGG